MYLNSLKAVIVFAALASSSYGKQASGIAGFDQGRPPNIQEWQHFLSQKVEWRAQQWQQWQAAGIEWEDWAWQWRSAWLRGCRDNKSVWCTEIMKKGLFDKAAVVRGETALLLANLYEGSRNRTLIKLLIRAYRLPANERNGKPLFMKRKFVYALHKVGMPERSLRKLAGKNYTNYLNKLTKRLNIDKK